MPPPLLIDLQSIDASKAEYDRAAIYSKMPHAHEFALLDAVVHFDRPSGIALAYVDCRVDAWWARGHIPGHPIFPGVLQLEAAAQLTAFITRYASGCRDFVAFGGVDECRFREAIYPPARFWIIAKVLEDRPRRVITQVQGVVENRLAFEATITGLALKTP